MYSRKKDGGDEKRVVEENHKTPTTKKEEKQKEMFPLTRYLEEQGSWEAPPGIAHINSQSFVERKKN